MIAKIGDQPSVDGIGIGAQPQGQAMGLILGWSMQGIEAIFNSLSRAVTQNVGTINGAFYLAWLRAPTAYSSKPVFMNEWMTI
jgi:hypothetical protein